MTLRLRHALVVAAIAVLAAAVVLVVAFHRPAPPATRPAAPETRPPLWTASEKRAIEAAVAKAAAAAPKLSLRPALDGDATDTDERRDLEAVYGEYHPYFARGDLDGDGRLDFVQAFVEKGKNGLWFHVAAFFGRPDGSFSEPVWVERAISLADGDVTLERSLVVITPDLAADPARRWRWEVADHEFVDADAETPGTGTGDGDAPEETPDQKPRARI